MLKKDKKSRQKDNFIAKAAKSVVQDAVPQAEPLSKTLSVTLFPSSKLP